MASTELAYKSVSQLKKGGIAVFNGHPCKILQMVKSKPGKHGSSKYHLVGQDLFTNKKIDALATSHDTMVVPSYSKDEFPVISCIEGYVSLLLDNGEVRSDLYLQSTNCEPIFLWPAVCSQLFEFTLRVLITPKGITPKVAPAPPPFTLPNLAPNAAKGSSSSETTSEESSESSESSEFLEEPPKKTLPRRAPKGRGRARGRGRGRERGRARGTGRGRGRGQ